MYKRGFAIITGLAGVGALIVAGVLLYIGMPITWLMFLKLAIGATSLLAAVFIWTGHRLRIATGVVAWLLIGVWAAPFVVFQAMKFGW